MYNDLKKSNQIITGNDFGNDGQASTKTVGYYAKTSSMLEFQARLLYRLVNYLKPKTILELGTNIGKSSAYMAAGNPHSKIVSVDGNKALCKFALEQHQKLGMNQIQIFDAPFDSFLEELDQSFDFVFVDGNHHYDPTTKYFQLLKSKINSGGCMVFHDIYWSEGMKQAWREIKKDQDVVISLDLFFFGIVWFGKNQAKEGFKIRFPMNPLFLLF